MSEVGSIDTNDHKDLGQFFSSITVFIRLLPISSAKLQLLKPNINIQIF